MFLSVICRTHGDNSESTDDRANHGNRGGSYWCLCHRPRPITATESELYFAITLRDARPLAPPPKYSLAWGRLRVQRCPRPIWHFVVWTFGPCCDLEMKLFSCETKSPLAGDRNRFWLDLWSDPSIISSCCSCESVRFDVDTPTFVM